jgi:hypothetical protein
LADRKDLGYLLTKLKVATDESHLGMQQEFTIYSASNEGPVFVTLSLPSSDGDSACGPEEYHAAPSVLSEEMLYEGAIKAPFLRQKKLMLLPRFEETCAAPSLRAFIFLLQLEQCPCSRAIARRAGRSSCTHRTDDADTGPTGNA